MKSRRNFILIFATFILLEVVSISLVFNDGTLQRTKVMTLFSEISSFFYQKNENLRNYFSLRKINEELVLENQRLLDYLSFSSEDSTSVLDSTFQYISSKVIKNSVNNSQNWLIIDKGSKDGIEEGMGVISPLGIIGYIHSTSENFSRISSFLSTKNYATAIIKKTNTFGVLGWDGRKTNIATLKDIPIHTHLNIGDTIVTSGFSTIYPPNLVIGTISSYNSIDGTNYDVIVDLFLDYSSIDYVYVVKNLNREEIINLDNLEEGGEL